MRGPPDPEMRNRPAGHGTADRRKDFKEHEEPSLPISDLQAEKLRRLYSFCHATAVTIASLAFAVSR
jgi:hypothetical protein